MQPSSFWQEALLHEFANDCIWHALIPTIMITRSVDWKTIEKHIDLNDEVVVKAQKANLMCVYCEKKIPKDSWSRFVLRFVVGKKEVIRYPNDGKVYYQYWPAFNTAQMCQKCSNQRNLVGELDSNSDIHNVFLDHLYAMGKEIYTHIATKEVSGEETWRLICTGVSMSKAFILKDMGKKDACCAFCKKNKTVQRCSGCNYTRYCGTACSHPDWKRHKKECAGLRDIGFFYPLEKSKLISCDIKTKK